jgi:hypothetical protein
MTPTPHEFVEMIEQAIRGQKSPLDIAVALSINLQGGQVPAVSKMLAFVTEMQMLDAQGSAPVIALCERFGCSRATGYRKLRRKSHKPREVETVD